MQRDVRSLLRLVTPSMHYCFLLLHPTDSLHASTRVGAAHTQQTAWIGWGNTVRNITGGRVFTPEQARSERVAERPNKVDVPRQLE
jgi:hypothetical protein